MNKRVLRDDDIADLLGVTVKTVWNRFAMGAPMPPHYLRPGYRTRFYKPHAAIEWIKENNLNAYRKLMKREVDNDY